MDENLKKKVFAIIQKDVNIDPATIDPEGDFRENVSLDSMQFVAVLARLEKDLDIEVPISAMEAKTLNEFLGFIEAALEEKTAAAGK